MEVNSSPLKIFQQKGLRYWAFCQQKDKKKVKMTRICTGDPCEHTTAQHGHFELQEVP